MMDTLKMNGYRIKAATALAKAEIAGTRAAMREGNMGVVAGVVSIVAVVITLLIGTILAGSFTSVATNSTLGLDENWTAALNGVGDTAITSFSIASLLPIALVASLVIAVISVIVISR